MKTMRSCRTVIFDLDGTLLDTIDDLTASANHVLRFFGLPERSRSEIQSFVGNGIAKLISRILPGGAEDPRFDEAYREFRMYYNEHCMDQTKPYPGIPALLQKLKEDGYGTAIVSNKADFAVTKLSETYFPGLIDAAVGESSGTAKKPAPDMLMKALSIMGASLENAVYVGDSDVDIQTAGNAGIECILVTWGFREEEFLRRQGAKVFAADAEELERRIKNTNFQRSERVEDFAGHKADRNKKQYGTGMLRKHSG